MKNNTILYNYKNNVIELITNNNSKWIELNKGLNKLILNYEYTLKVNSNIIWEESFNEKLNVDILDNKLQIKEERSVLFPIVSIPIENLINIKSKSKMDNYIKIQQEQNAKKEFEIMKEVYKIGKSGELDNSWKYVGANKTRELFNRITDVNSIEYKKFMDNLVDPLIIILLHKSKLTECLDKLKVTIFELRDKLKKYPQVINMICMDYKIDIDELITYGEDSDMKIVQKM